MSLSEKFDSTWKTLGWMRASLAYLIRSLAIDSLGRGRRRARAGVGVSIVPLIVRGPNVEFARRHDKGAAQLERGQILADAVLGAKLKGSIRALDRVQVVVGMGGEPAFGQKLVGSFPVGRVAVQGLMDDPDEGAAGWISPAVRVDDVDAGRAFTQRRGWWEEAENFFDHGMRVRDLVEQMRGFDNGGRDRGEIGAEYRIVFGADTGHALRVAREDVVAVT